MSEAETTSEGKASGNASERGGEKKLPTRAVCEEALGALEELFDALPTESRAKHAGDKADVRRVLEMIIRYLGSPRAAQGSEPQGERDQEEADDDANRKVSEEEEDEEDEDDLLDQILEDVEDLQDEERAELFGLIANLYDVETGKAKPKDRKPRTRGRTA